MRQAWRGAVLVLAMAAFAWPASAQGTVDESELHIPPGLDVPYVPTPEGTVDQMLDMARLTSGDYLIDLGSGDGRVAIMAAQKFGARAYGIDIDPRRVAEARANAEKAGVADRVSFARKDLFETDLATADVITMYLLPSVNLKLRPHLMALRPGTRIVSHAFHMQDWRPDEHRQLMARDAYMWIVPARAEGRWNLATPHGRVALAVRQRFQDIEMAATMDGRPVAIRDAALRGAEIRFAADLPSGPAEFVGRIEGDAIRPVREVEDWNAVRTAPIP